MKKPGQDLERILFSKEDIDKRCAELGKEICDYYQDRNPLIIGVLKGCIPFMQHLVENIDIYCEVNYMAASSYEGTQSTGKIRITKDVHNEIENREILLVEDIIDTGLTVKVIKEHLMAKGAKDVKTVCLLSKDAKREEGITVDWYGFECPNYFVVGFGLDFNEVYRNVPYIGVLKEEMYK